MPQIGQYKMTGSKQSGPQKKKTSSKKSSKSSKGKKGK